MSLFLSVYFQSLKLWLERFLVKSNRFNGQEARQKKESERFLVKSNRFNGQEARQKKGLRSSLSLFTKNKKALVRFSGLTIIFHLAACSVIPESPPPPRLFDLGKVAHETRFKQLPVTISVDLPNALDVSDGNGLLIREKAGNELSFLPGVSFPDRLPDLIQMRFIEGLTGTNGFLSVMDNRSNVRQSIDLLIRVFAFEVVENENGFQAFVRLKIDLFDRNSRQVIAAKTLSADYPVGKIEPKTVATALGLALSRIEAKAFPWIYTQSRDHIILMRNRQIEETIGR